MEKDFDVKEFKGLDLEFEEEVLERDYDVVYVKYNKYSKEYAYLIDDCVERGMKVYIPERDEPLEVIRTSRMPESKLPFDSHEMKYATLNKPFQLALEQLLKNNPILRIVEKQTELIGRNEIIEDLFCAIKKKRIRNSLLIGDAGCGKTTIVESLSEKIKEDYTILGFNVGELIAGTKLRGMVEEKLINIFNGVIECNKNSYQKIILFIDEFHMIVTDCGCGEAVSLHDILKPYFTNPNVIVIGATTIQEFNQYIKNDHALMRRISPIYVENLSDSCILKILDNFADHMIEENLLLEIINETKNIPNTTNPDISLEVVDRAITKLRVFGREINYDSIEYEINKIKQIYENF